MGSMISIGWRIIWREAKGREAENGTMTSIDDVMIEITPQVLLKAYACGIFPMAESAEDNALYWIDPERRGILPLDRVHVPQRLARTIRKGGFEVRIDHDFEAVIEGCAAPRSGRRSTWINGRIRSLYRDLFALGHCHTVEIYEGERLIGGLYGMHLGRAFFGESMFHRARDASLPASARPRLGGRNFSGCWKGRLPAAAVRRPSSRCSEGGSRARKSCSSSARRRKPGARRREGQGFRRTSSP